MANKNELNKNEFSIIWQQCDANNLAERFYVPEYRGCLPFFIWGDDLLSFKEGRVVKFNEEQLLHGLLYGLYGFEHDLKPWKKEGDLKVYINLLGTLSDGFGVKNHEKMILDIACDMREKFSADASRRVLETGRRFFHQSSKIKSDLVLQLWSISEGEDEYSTDWAECLGDIDKLIPEIDFEDVMSSAKEAICYYGICAKVLLGKNGQVQAYLNSYVSPNIDDNILLRKIEALLENPAVFKVSDLTVH